MGWSGRTGWIGWKEKLFIVIMSCGHPRTMKCLAFVARAFQARVATLKGSPYE